MCDAGIASGLGYRAGVRAAGSTGWAGRGRFAFDGGGLMEISGAARVVYGLSCNQEVGLP